MRNAMILLMLVALMAVGCAKEKKNNTSSAPAPIVGPYIPPGSGPGLGPGANFTYGGTADLVPVSISRFSEYTGRPMNNPQNVKVNVNLTKFGNGFGGHITIQYDDTGVTSTGYFTSLDQPGGTVSGDVQNNQYNIWFVAPTGELVFHGFFEDFMGGLILVIDQVTDLGDGAGPEDLVGGSIWFKNHPVVTGPVPPTSCWFVKAGPYDCRSWVVNGNVNTTSAILPDGGYKKLGDFQDLSLDEAFNGELSL